MRRNSMNIGRKKKRINDKELLSNYIVVYRQTRLDKFLSSFIPYHIPLISKRQRVRYRRFFKNRWRKKLMNDMTKVLKDASLNGYDYETKGFIEWDYEWEVISAESH